MPDTVTAFDVVRIQESGCDPEVAAAFYEQQYHGRGVRFALADAPFGFGYTAIGDDRLTLRSSHVTAHRSGTIVPDRQYRLTWSGDGRFVVDQGAGAVVVEPGTPVMFPTAGPFRVTAEPSTQQIMQFDADFLEAVAVAGTDLPATPLRLPVTVPPVLLHSLRAVLRNHTRALKDPMIDPHDRAVLDIAVAQAVLGAFEPNHNDPLQTGRTGSTVERAEDFMRERFAEPLSVVDIAVGVGVGVRTLQQAFLVERATTPMRWLRDLRLSKTQAALRIANPVTDTVSQIAFAHGFRHMGRFSGAYFAYIGEHPSDTLLARD